jgi:symplekin
MRSDVSALIIRSKFASVWLNEEWYNGKLGRPAQYSANLDAVTASYLPKVDAKDKALGTFLTSLPEIPISVISVLESLCLDVERSIVGFLALRELVETRPPVRAQTLDILLQLCTHPDIKLRVMAISTVKRWVPGSPMSTEVIGYGLQVLKRLTTATESKIPAEGEEDVKMEEPVEETKTDTISRFLGDITPETVRQHVELIFALSRRQQDLLEHIFQAYIGMQPDIQDALESLLTPLIQSLGPTRELLDQLSRFPPGAEKLALKVLYILSGAGSSPVLVNVVKSLMAERDLNPKFVIPIIGQLDKVGRIHIRKESADYVDRDRKADPQDRLVARRRRLSRACQDDVRVDTAKDDSCRAHGRSSYRRDQFETYHRG